MRLNNITLYIQQVRMIGGGSSCRFLKRAYTGHILDSLKHCPASLIINVDGKLWEYDNIDKLNYPYFYYKNIIKSRLL
jgi:hypothetical protein